MLRSIGKKKKFIWKGAVVAFLKETEFAGEVVWLGHVPAGDGLRAQAVEQLDFSYAGVAGERHEGLTRTACVRLRNVHPQGVEMRNVRQVTVLSEEEMVQIADEMGIEALAPEHLGVSVVLRGIPDLTHLPPSSRLQGPDGLTLVVDLANPPCNLPAREIEADLPGHGSAFKAAAKGRRGITGWVERPGSLRLGRRMSLFVPDQRAWSETR